MALNKKDTLILGLGNDILTDDGIGPRLVKDLCGIVKADNIVFNIASCGGLEILELIKGYRKVIFIDAIRTSGGKPGDVCYFLPSDFRETSNISNLHDINFLTALKMGDILELDLPTDLHIIGIEIIEDMEFSDELSPPLREKYPGILEKVETLILNCLSG